MVTQLLLAVSRHGRVLLTTIMLLSGSLWIPAAFALEDEWYIGLGGGGSWLVPNPVVPGIDDDENSASYGTFLLGKDFSTLNSVQFQLHSLGETELTNGDTVEYSAADLSVLYRLYDTRDGGLDADAFGVALYGRAGIGFIDRNVGSELELKNDSQFYFGGGLGAEFFLYGPLSLRLELLFLDVDAQLGSLSLQYRFGGKRAGRPAIPAASPVQRPATETSPGPTSTPPNPANQSPATPAPGATGGVITPQQPSIAAQDSDADGVADAADECPQSRAGYPVRPNGCPLLDGVLAGVSFDDRSGTLKSQSFEQLDYLANLLKRFPQARIQIFAHTDSRGTPRDQAVVTRARLRSIGTYLIRQGVSANRLVLRSLGGQNPLYDNATQAGRDANNRIEILEQR